jgi:hypothetical protein
MFFGGWCVSYYFVTPESSTVTCASDDVGWDPRRALIPTFGPGATYGLPAWYVHRISSKVDEGFNTDSNIRRPNKAIDVQRTYAWARFGDKPSFIGTERRDH